MMLELEPIQNVSLAALHARRKKIRARLFSPPPLPPAARPSPPRLSWTPEQRPSFLAPQPIPAPPDPQDTADALPQSAEPLFPNIKNILAQVAQFQNVTVEEIKSHSRNASFVLARQIACYLAKSLTRRSLPDIGRRIGGRDHTTVLHSIRKIERLIAADQTLADQISIIRQTFIQTPSDTPAQDAPLPGPGLPHLTQPSNKNSEAQLKEQGAAHGTA